MKFLEKFLPWQCPAFLATWNTDYSLAKPGNGLDINDTE